METLKAIDSRRSVRGYLARPVEEEKLDTIVACGNKAPVAGEFFMSVVTDRRLLDRIDEEGKAAAEESGNEFLAKRVSVPGYRLTYGAPALIVLSAPEGGYGAANTACAAENICLAATDLGLGTCYLAGFLMAFGRCPSLLSDLKIPEGYVPQCGVIVGYEGGTQIPSVPREGKSNVARIG